VPEVILGLPAHLREVPPAPDGPNDPDRVAKRDAWRAWVYAMRQHRAELHQLVAENPDLIPIELRKCENDPAYFMAMYGTLFEPRSRNRRGGYIPWIPFARQVQLIRWWQACMMADDETADGALSKSRDVGASWEFCLIAVWGWRFEFPFNVLFISRVQNMVDSKSPKSLFWKVGRIIQNLPVWMLPKGFEWGRHRTELFIENPDNGNTLTGESTNANSGVGDRVTMAVVDEAAKIDGFLDIWLGMTDVTDHRFAISTEDLRHGPDFYNLTHGVDIEYPPSVFTIDYWEHPDHDDEWYERQVRRYSSDPDQFRREILRDPRISSSLCYPKAAEIEIITTEYRLGNPLYVSMDPGFDDNFAIVWIQFNPLTNFYEVLEAYTNNRYVAAFYGTILTGEAKSGEWEYTDADLELMAWTKNLPGATYYGDTYGTTKLGATADTWYSELRKFGIYVNTDRTPADKVTADKMKLRTHAGRREALRWLMPRLKFNDTPGCRQCLAALQQNQYDRTGDKIGERGMKRDWTTHYTSAMEYFAAHIKYARDYELADARRSARADRTDELAATRMRRPSSYRALGVR